MNIGDRVFTASGFVWIIAARWDWDVVCLRFTESGELIAFRTDITKLRQCSSVPLAFGDKVMCSGVPADVVGVSERGGYATIRFHNGKEQRVGLWILALEKLHGGKSKFKGTGDLREATPEEV